MNKFDLQQFSVNFVDTFRKSIGRLNYDRLTWNYTPKLQILDELQFSIEAAMIGFNDE